MTTTHTVDSCTEQGQNSVTNKEYAKKHKSNIQIKKDSEADGRSKTDRWEERVLVARKTPRTVNPRVWLVQVASLWIRHASVARATRTEARRFIGQNFSYPGLDQKIFPNKKKTISQSEAV